MMDVYDLGEAAYDAFFCGFSKCFEVDVVSHSLVVGS